MRSRSTRASLRDLPNEVGADAIVRSVIDLARNLDLVVVAEGVESGEAMDRLRELGCDEVQGYFLSRPVSAPEIEAFARSFGELLLPTG